jgi:hypothetical protein
MVVWRQVAGGIGGVRVSGELEGLAPAAAEVDLTQGAAMAGLRQPVSSAEAVEQIAVVPGIREPIRANVGCVGGG